MKILVVKLTSMGDALHLLPALSDLQAHYSALGVEVSVDWMIEESFAEIPGWHPLVDRVIPVATRRWRRLRWRSLVEFWGFLKQTRTTRYDVILDAQGLIKSAAFARFARLKSGGRRAGFSAASIKEKPAARLYRERHDVERQQHAINRLRQLFAAVFNYPVPDAEPDYALASKRNSSDATIAFLHATTWPSKHLPEQHWHDLVALALADGYRVVLPWGNDAEHARAQRIAAGHTAVSVLPRSTLGELKATLQSVAGAIAVDTGLGHLAAAVGTPTVSVYGSTDAQLTGAIGRQQIHLQTAYPCSPCLLKECDRLTSQVTTPPCYARTDPADIWAALFEQII